MYTGQNKSRKRAALISLAVLACFPAAGLAKSKKPISPTDVNHQNEYSNGVLVQPKPISAPSTPLAGGTIILTSPPLYIGIGPIPNFPLTLTTLQLVPSNTGTVSLTGSLTGGGPPVIVPTPTVPIEPPAFEGATAVFSGLINNQPFSPSGDFAIVGNYFTSGLTVTNTTAPEPSAAALVGVSFLLPLLVRAKRSHRVMPNPVMPR